MSENVANGVMLRQGLPSFGCSHFLNQCK